MSLMDITLPLQTNTFQTVLAQSGNNIFALYLYADGLIQWTTAYGYGGNNGFGGDATVVRFYFNDSYYRLPGSGTCSIIHIASRSNVNIPGLFVFPLEAEAEQNFGIWYHNTGLYIDIFWERGGVGDSA